MKKVDDWVNWKGTAIELDCLELDATARLFLRRIFERTPVGELLPRESEEKQAEDVLSDKGEDIRDIRGAQRSTRNADIAAAWEKGWSRRQQHPHVYAQSRTTVPPPNHGVKDAPVITIGADNTMEFDGAPAY